MFQVELISKHEINLAKSKEIRKSIQSKVNEIIQKLKDEEAKLLGDVDDFERIESNLLADKNERLNSLEEINKFSLSTHNSLTLKEETDNDVMDMKNKCTEFNQKLKEFSHDLLSRYATRQMNFIIPKEFVCDDIYSVGYVETVIDKDEIMDAGRINQIWQLFLT